MSKRISNKLAKPFDVHSALIVVCVTGERYMHPTLSLRNASEESEVRIKFQSHRLDLPDALGGVIDFGRSHPIPNRFDFGPHPYSACYGAKFEEARSYSMGNLRAEISGNTGPHLRKLAKLCDVFARTALDYNLRHVAPDCELGLYVETLEKLGVPVYIERYVERRKLDNYGWRQDLPEDQRCPAFLFKREVDKARAAGVTP